MIPRRITHAAHGKASIHSWVISNPVPFAAPNNWCSR